MKKIVSICAAILMAASVFAQAPNKMSYQAVIRNNSNALIANHAVGMRISILQGSQSGTAVYVETQTPTTNANGLASIEIGGGTVVSGNFSTINWTNGSFFVKTETDPSGGNSYSITGASQLLSVPYAFYAKSAGTVSGGGSGGSFTHYIGEQFGGGVIFHLWKDNTGVEHGLIVDKTDLSTRQIWSNMDYALIGTTAQSSWDGLSNSNAIVGQKGHVNSAAALCLNSSNGGQSDWYLPSIDELSLLWHNRFNVNKSISTIGGATVLPIWANYSSSMESGSSSMWYFNFQLGSAYSDNKNGAYYVRAVRAF
ncbi:MAG: DUF1566 domain-containing protein [Saprospiraceae bacterium]